MSALDAIVGRLEDLKPADIEAMAKAFAAVDWRGIQHQFTKFDRHQAFVEAEQIAALVAIGFPPAGYIKTALIVADFVTTYGKPATAEELEIIHPLPEGR